MVPIFNISSAGASATVWVTKLLNQHPRIVCMHALREDPFCGERIEPAAMVAGLLKMAQSCQDDRTFGVIHAYYDAKIYRSIKEDGGGFLAILRHPINRIHSLFTHHYRDINGRQVRYDDVYRTMSEDGLEDEFAEIFRKRVAETLCADVENLITVEPGEIAIFEIMTSDAAYCRSRLEALLGTDLASLMPVIEASLGTKYNQHVSRTEGAEAIYDRWPRMYKDIFQACAAQFNLVGLRDLYRHFGYDLAPMLVG